jgi:hypothetical protein
MWRLDYQTDKKVVRVEHLDSITLGTDGNGKKLSQPVNLLVAGLGYSSSTGAAIVAVRDDATNKWFTTDITAPAPAAPQNRIEVRAIGTHTDKITGVDHVFAGAYPGGIVSGVYDEAASGQIRWDSTPELVEIEERVMSFGECNGELYAAIKPAIYKRVDGLNPTWEKVYEYTVNKGSGMRGLTAIANPKGGDEVLLMALEGFGAKIVYLDPSDNNSITTDLDLNEFLLEQWGADWEMMQELGYNYVTTAYNDMTPVTDPKTGEDLLLMGLYAYNLSKPDSAWYLVRYPDASYMLQEIPYIFDLRGWTKAPTGTTITKALGGTRTIRMSPFAKDNGQVLYFGGFDCFYQTSHNTAWIYSVDIDTALGISQNR